MNQRKSAWVYCRIDAPEDTHGVLKEQRQQLMDYAEQMCFTVVGSSEDTGNSNQLGCPGLLFAKQAAKDNRINVLLLNGLPRYGNVAFKALSLLRNIEQFGTTIYSPLQGKITIREGKNF